MVSMYVNRQSLVRIITILWGSRKSERQELTQVLDTLDQSNLRPLFCAEITRKLHHGISEDVSLTSSVS